MLRPRIIPCLLIHNGGLVKTVKFRDPKYVGDPLNAVRIFNEKEVDELIVCDIDATVQNRLPNFNLIADLAAECRMPLCYSGGVKTPEHVERIISLGVEKVAISNAAVQPLSVIREAAERVGSQSIVVVMDVVKTEHNTYKIYTHNGTRNTCINPVEFAELVQKSGAGEILLNSVDHDGMMNGYDHVLIKAIREVVDLPMSVLGGAGNLRDMEELFRLHGVIGAAAGSLFVFKGKFRAVLIQYPLRIDKDKVCAAGMKLISCVE